MTQSGARDAQNEEQIFSDNFGGLNTVANNLNVPYTDSTELLNMEVTVSGDLVKRQGTRIIYEQNTPVSGPGIIPITTTLDYNYIITKQNLGLHLYEIINNEATEVITKANVFNNSALNARPNYTKTAEPEPRIIITTGFNQPVQLKFVEQQQLASETTQIVFNNADRYANATTTNLLVYRNRLRQSGWSVSYSAGNLTISNLTLAVGDVVDIILVVWQRFAEALRYLGNRFTNNTSRFHVTESDQNIAIPESLRDNIAPLSIYGSTTLSNYFQVRAYKSTAYGDTSTFKNDKRPTTNDEYAHGDGGIYIYDSGDANKVVNAAGLFITYATIITSSVATPLILSRMRRLESLNGNIGIAGDSLDVYVDGALVTQNTNATTANVAYGSYYLLNQSGDAVITNSTDPAFFIEFNASEQIGVPSTSVIELVNKSKSFIGSAATVFRDPYADGSYIAAYGLGQFADYNKGSFPSNVALYQGRLVIAGFPTRQLDVLFSNSLDTVTPGVNYSSFQFDAFTGASTDPFSSSLNSSPDDRITGVTTWQSSLFIFSRRAVFRISGGDQINITPTNKTTSQLSNIGLVNSYCFAKTQQTIYYLSDTGMYDLNPDFRSGEYLIEEQTIKIRDQFSITLDPIYEPLAWLSFDPTKRLVYLGLPIRFSTATSDRLFIFNTVRKSWTRWETGGGFQIYNATEFIDRQLGLGFVAACVTQRSGNTPNNFVFLRFYSDVEKYSDEVGFIDFQRKTIGTGSPIQITQEPIYTVQYTTVNGIQLYSTRREDIQGPFHQYGFDPINIASVNDVVVDIESAAGAGDSVILENGKDFVKFPNDKIYLRFNPGDGRKLNLTLSLPVLETEQGRLSNKNPNMPLTDRVVYVDRIKQGPWTDWLIFDNPGDPNSDITVNTAPASSVIITGQAYACVYATPTFAKNSLLTKKRNRYLNLYFDNSIGLNTWEEQDLNSASNQDPRQLAGRPKNRLNATAIIRYADAPDGEIEYDIYGFDQLVWDDFRVDIVPSSLQFRRNALFKIHLLGISTHYQAIIYSFDETAMILSAYQLTTDTRGSRGINWS